MLTCESLMIVIHCRCHRQRLRLSRCSRHRVGCRIVQVAIWRHRSFCILWWGRARALWLKALRKRGTYSYVLVRMLVRMFVRIAWCINKEDEDDEEEPKEEEEEEEKEEEIKACSAEELKACWQTYFLNRPKHLPPPWMCTVVGFRRCVYTDVRCSCDTFSGDRFRFTGIQEWRCYWNCACYGHDWLQ